KGNTNNSSRNNRIRYLSVLHFISINIVYISIISCLEIPMIRLAIYAVYSLPKSKQAAPVFVMNLLVSDLIQTVCMLPLTIGLNFYWMTALAITWLGAGYTGLYFMTCIAVEGYVLIAHPVWHRSHRSVKCFACTLLTGWLLPFIVIPVYILINALFKSLVLLIVMILAPLIPYAVIILCFVGSCRSLSHSISLTPLKKQLVLAPLFFVVISYTFLILPLQICLFVNANIYEFPLDRAVLTLILYLLNPLVDCFLYVFMRSDAENIIRTTPHCCSRLKRVQTEMVQTTSMNVQRDHV
uniref:G-protein coupled receptors family 1 profile domain-containing protein n=1 Tax=Sinocyclocheilus rhinocerous TaxID=307959 RepID=A0A673FFP6_9TELE